MSHECMVKSGVGFSTDKTAISQLVTDRGNGDTEATNFLFISTLKVTLRAHSLVKVKSKSLGSINML